jgi:hypothetical protein
VAAPIAIGSDPGRVVISMVLAGEIVLDTEVHSVETADVRDLARLLGQSLGRAARRLEVWPELIALRHTAFADTLGAELRQRDCEIRIDPRLRHLDTAARSLLERMVGNSRWPPLAAPDTWGGWGLPDHLVADYFRAFARVWRAEPWEHIDETRAVFVRSEGHPEEVLSVLGATASQRGVVLHAEFDDFDHLLSPHAEENPLADVSGLVLFMGSGHRSDFPPAMQREVLKAGWEVAAPEAYPQLLPVNAPGGGITVDLLRRATSVLDALAALVERDAPALNGPHGVVFRHAGMEVLVPPAQLPPEGPLGQLRSELEGLEFETEAELERWMSDRVEQMNTEPTPLLSGLTPAQAERLYREGLEDGAPLVVSDDLDDADLAGARFVQNARVVLDALRSAGGTSATKAGNLNRAFVAEMLEQMQWGQGDLEFIRRGNKVINEQDAWDLHLVRVVLEVAKLIRRRKGRFTLTRAGRSMAEPEAIGPLAAHLFRVFFGRFNLAYLDRAPEEPDFQPLVPITLWRVGVEAREWQGMRSLADRVLPPELRKEPAGPLKPDMGALVLRTRLVDPLVGFGLMEERTANGTRPAAPWPGPTATEVRVAPLFDRMLRFDWESPAGA